MRLGFHYHIPAIYKGDRIHTMGLQGRFVDSLAEYCESVICFQHTPMPYELPFMDYEVKASNVSLVGLGPHNSVPKRILRFPQIKHIILPWRDKLDVMLIRGPSPLLPEVAYALEGLPIALLIVGDYLLGIDDLPQPRWRKELIRVWSIWNKRQQLKVATKSLTFVNSRKLYEEFQSLLPNLVETRTTTLSKDDFYEREDTCESPPYHLLYTGRMDRAKGLIDMIEALALLVKDEIDVIFDFVGWPSKGDTILDDMFSLAQARGIKDRVIYHGFKSVGPELFAYYKSADIYLIASRVSEGFPRTIWEAMAHCLPVVSTSVGSIPDFVNGNALLVEPSKPQELANAVSKIITNPSLRQKLISGGRSLVNENTFKYQTKKMVDEITNWLTVYGKKPT